MHDESLEWQEISTEHIICDRWIDFRRSVYRYPDGRVFEPFYTFSKRDYAVVVASDEQGRIICVRQFRQGIREVTTEFPAGGLEESDSEQSRTEAALAAAKRELLEETGYASEDWSYLLKIPSQATISDNYAYLFRARSCKPVAAQALDETEMLKVILLDAGELEDLIASGEFQQAVHLLAWIISKEKG